MATPWRVVEADARHSGVYVTVRYKMPGDGFFRRRYKTIYVSYDTSIATARKQITEEIEKRVLEGTRVEALLNLREGEQ